MLKNDKIYRGITIALVALFVASALMAVLAFATPHPAAAKGGGNAPNGCCCTKEWLVISYPCTTSCFNGDIHSGREYDRYKYYRWCDPCAGSCGGWIFYDWECRPC